MRIPSEKAEAFSPCLLLILSFSAWFKQWHLHTDTMGYLKDLTVQFSEMISKDHGCSRYLITCRVARTILEILEISSSVPKGCVPAQRKEWLKTSQDGDEDTESKFRQKQAENRLILHQCKRTMTQSWHQGSSTADHSASVEGSKGQNQNSFWYFGGVVFPLFFFPFFSSLLEHSWNGHWSFLTGPHISTAFRFLGPVGS